MFENALRTIFFGLMGRLLTTTTSSCVTLGFNMMVTKPETESTRVDSYPTDVTVNETGGVTEMENLPFKFELVPREVPVMPMEANETGLPVWLSKTAPSINC